jgi:chromosome segregation ATPase
MTEITAVRWGLLGRARLRFARAAAPPSLRALIVLMVSVFLLGGVLSALAFVGVWRHTAADANRAQAGQLVAGQALQVTRARLSGAEAELANARAALTSASAGRKLVADELARLRRVNERAATSLPPRLRAITNEADALAGETAKLGSALATLNDYLRNAAATGIDPAFLAAQVRYLTSATGATRATATTLAKQAQRAQASAAALQQKR